MLLSRYGGIIYYFGSGRPQYLWWEETDPDCFVADYVPNLDLEILLSQWGEAPAGFTGVKIVHPSDDLHERLTFVFRNSNIQNTIDELMSKDYDNY